MLAAVLLLLGVGCVRQATEQATRGVMDALEQPDRPDEARRTGAPRKADRRKELVESVAEDAVSASLKALRREATSLTPVVRQAGEGVTGGVIAGAIRHDDALLSLVEESATAAGRGFTRGAAEQLGAQIGPHQDIADTDELTAPMAAIARRVAAAAVSGAAEQLRAEMTACPTGDAQCAYAFIQRASRAAAMGATEGIGKEVPIWHFAVAFGLGVGCAAAGAWLMHIATVRHERHAPR